LNETLNETLLGGAAVVTGVVIFALPVYYAWKLVPRRPPKIPHLWPG
jgi:hypothetical protein